jgi:hypothetical protein
MHFAYFGGCFVSLIFVVAWISLIVANYTLRLFFSDFGVIYFRKFAMEVGTMSDTQSRNLSRIAQGEIPTFVVRSRGLQDCAGQWRTIGSVWAQEFGQEGFVLELRDFAVEGQELLLVPVCEETFSSYWRS